MSFAAVLFDNDGLTLDTEPAWTRAETTLFARHGSTFTMEHKRSLLGTAPPVAAAKLEAMLGVPGDELNAELHELVLEEVAAGVEPMPGAVDLLGALRAAGVPVGLVSNSPRSFVESGLRSAGLDGRLRGARDRRGGRAAQAGARRLRRRRGRARGRALGVRRARGLADGPGRRARGRGADDRRALGPRA